MNGASRRVALVLVALSWAVAAQETPEYQLKAAFVAKFPEFTEWPAAVLEQRPTIDICVARPNPFAGSLSRVTSDASVRGRQLRVREIAAAGDVPSCLVLFIPAGSATDQQRALLATAEKSPVLTIGETPAFLDAGGIISLRLLDGRVRFDVNISAADRTGVRLSSQLLRLALSVRGAAQ